MPIAVLPALAILVGATCGAHLDVPRAVSWSQVLLLAAAVVCMRRQWPRAFLVAVLAGFALSSLLLASDARRRALHPQLRTTLHEMFGGFDLADRVRNAGAEPVVSRFIMLEDASPSDDAVGVRAAVVAIQVRDAWVAIPREGVRLTIGGQTTAQRLSEWRAGRTAIAPVAYRRPVTYLNDGVGDFERDSLLAGTALLGSTKSGLLLDVVARGSPVQEAAASIRRYVRAQIERRVATRDPIAAAIVAAVLLGDRTGLPDEVRLQLQAAGTYHVIAISGGNIALIAGLVLGVLYVIGVRGRTAAALAIVALALYAEIVTAGPSVWRATLMAIAYLFARVLDLRTPAWQTTALTAALLVVANPLDVGDVGFMLTFGATVALLLSSALVKTMATRLEDAAPVSGTATTIARTGARWLAMSLAASLAVEIALLPVSAVLFSRVTFAGVLLNLVAVPLMAILQVAGLVLVCAPGLDTVSSLAGWIVSMSAQGLLRSARFVEVAPFLAPRLPSPSLVLAAGYYIALALSIWVRRTRRIAVAVVMLCGALIVTGRPLSGGLTRDEAERDLRLTMLDVGQGESMLLEVAGAPPLVVDAGGAPFGSSGDDIGARVVSPALWARGIRSLGALLVTHGDPDHIGGAEVVVSDLVPHRLWTGVPVPSHEPTRDLLASATSHHAITETLYAGADRPWGRARIRVLNPPEPDWERPRVRNDDSIVLEVRFGDVALLLTGDISATVEHAIASQLEDAPIRILKVAHHGSRTSTSAVLLDAWRPQIALISCGRANRFGHPTPEVLDRLEAIGAHVYRTDQDGEITLESDGKSVRVHTWMERHR